jgi:hypothetical protein
MVVRSHHHLRHFLERHVQIRRVEEHHIDLTLTLLESQRLKTPLHALVRLFSSMTFRGETLNFGAA